MISTILTATLVMLALAVVFSTALVVANIKLAVHVDPRQAELEHLLPRANCGGCGYASCAAYAKAVHLGRATVDRCTLGGPLVTQRLASLMGVNLTENFPYRPVLHCSATQSDRLKQGRYVGVSSCAAADVVGGVQACAYGCLGLADCVDSCEYDAMTMVDGLPRIDYDNCVGCGACVRACPRNILEQIPFKVEQMLVVGCANHDPGRAVREVCKVGCIGCGLCARKQPDVIHMENNLAIIDYERYTGDEDFGPVVEKCPMESLVNFGKPSREHEEALADTGAADTGTADQDDMLVAGRPRPAHTQAEDLHWRG